MRLEAWAVLLAAVAAGSAFFGLVFAWWQVMEAKDRARTDRTFALIDRILARDSLEAMLDAATVRKKIENLPPHERFAAFQSLKSSHDKKARLQRGHVLYLLNQFERIAYSYRKKLIRREIARGSLGPVLRTKHRRWSWYIDGLQDEARASGVDGDRLPYGELRRLAERWDREERERARD